MSYPLPNYRFAVSLMSPDPYEPPSARPPSARSSLTAVLAGAFSDVTGMSGEMEILAYPEGGQNAFVHQLPGRHTWGRITLKKGVVLDRILWDWFDKGLSRSLGARRDGRISLQDPNGKTAITWEFRAALAAKWTGPDLSAGGMGAISIESLEVVHQGITQVSNGGN
jgi:phage tail-like protein